MGRGLVGGSINRRAVVGMRRVGFGDRMGRHWQAAWAVERSIHERLRELPVAYHGIRGWQRGLGHVAVKGRGVRRVPGMVVGTICLRMVSLGQWMHGWIHVHGKYERCQAL